MQIRGFHLSTRKEGVFPQEASHERARQHISRHVWATKYHYVQGETCENTIADSWPSIARALAASEPHDAVYLRNRQPQSEPSP
jgi:hypothetical protein